MKLTAREHFIVHALLIRFLTGVEKHKMEWAFHKICTWSVKNKFHKIKYINSKIYENFKKTFQKGKNNSQYGTHWCYNLKTGEIKKCINLPDENWIFGRKNLNLIKNKKEIYKQKHKEAELNGLIRNDGRINGNGITNKQWLERKNIILNSGVDFSKYGWKSEVQRKTTLTRRQIDNTIKHFKIDFDFVFVFKRK